jgi:hypothetical protein
VRNYLVVVPFLSLLVARALGELVERLPRPSLRLGAEALVVAAGVANAVFLFRAAESIRHPDVRRDVRNAVDYVRGHPAESFYLSKRVRALAAAQHLELPENVASSERAEHVVFFARAEGPSGPSWQTNDPALADAVFGPLDASFYWYSTWAGSDHVVIMETRRVRSMGASLVF